MDWYEEKSEAPIRDVVKVLRDNGFNTENSCGHEMYVQCDYFPDAEIKSLDDLLYNNGYRDYLISVELIRSDGCLYTSIDVRFKDLI